MICVSIGEKTVDGCIDALRNLEFAEIRIDKIENIALGGIQKIFSQPVRLIATCRPGGTLDENARKELLLSAIESGASFVDIEVENRDEYKKEVISAARKKGCKVIVSSHNYNRTPSCAELGQVLDWCFDSGADIAKIACMVNSEQDCARLLGLLDDHRKIVVVGMGKSGRIVRIAAPLLGSPFTFASLGNGKETADGQINKEEMEQIMKLLGELKNGK